MGPESEPFRVLDFEVDAAAHCFSRNGESIKLEPRTMALLLYLARHPASVVNREELEREVWRDTVVGYDALNNTVAKLRKAFTDDPKNPRFIQTVPKVGYRLIADVSVSPLAAGDPAVTVEPRPQADRSLERKLAAITLCRCGRIQSVDRTR
jgi:DNA-binding winged helix-turn-helix (wHTH) protein